MQDTIDQQIKNIYCNFINFFVRMVILFIKTQYCRVFSKHQFQILLVYSWWDLNICMQRVQLIKELYEQIEA